MMKTKKNEIKKLSKEELQNKLRELKVELMTLRGQIAVKAPLKSPGMVKSVRKNIARIYTYLKQKEVQQTK